MLIYSELFAEFTKITKDFLRFCIKFAAKSNFHPYEPIYKIDKPVESP